jgi:hypothetical protein
MFRDAEGRACGAASKVSRDAGAPGATGFP